MRPSASEILGEERAVYGEQIVSTLSRQLTLGYGSGFSRQNLFHMIRFVEAWPEESEAAELAEYMGWSHFKEILDLDDAGQRNFYAQMCRVERWSVRALRARVRSMLFERTAISRQPESLIHRELEQLRESDRVRSKINFAPISASSYSAPAQENPAWWRKQPAYGTRPSSIAGRRML